jgi:hypothetical protein
MWGIWHKDNHAFVVETTGRILSYNSKEIAEDIKECSYIGCEVRPLPGKPIYGIWLEHEETKSWFTRPDGMIIHSEYYNVMLAQMGKEQATLDGLAMDSDDKVVLKVVIFGENGEPVDIE